MTEIQFLRQALRLARRGLGSTSPNPMVGAVLVKRGKIIGRGWHQKAGWPHAEIEALRDAEHRGRDPRASTLFVTLEPCSTQGRTPPCTDALIKAGIRRVVVGAVDPNPRHAGRGLEQLRRAGIEVRSCAELAEACRQLNEPFNHWIVQRTPLVTVKAAMTLDGKIATATGESKWITGLHARAKSMELRRAADAILVGINTVLADDPSLTIRRRRSEGGGRNGRRSLRRIILDSMARTPLKSKVVGDEFSDLTTIVVSRRAPRRRVAALAKRVRIVTAPLTRRKILNSDPRASHASIDLAWLLRRLGGESVTHLLVEGGGEVNASFLRSGLAQRVVFFYAPRILSGRAARKGVAGEGASRLDEVLQLGEVQWKKCGEDLMLEAKVDCG